ncbi:MAG: tetratricopeptide repeat protein [Bacilli bacterium]
MTKKKEKSFKSKEIRLVLVTLIGLALITLNCSIFLNRELAYNLGIISFEQGNYQEAINHFQATHNLKDSKKYIEKSNYYSAIRNKSIDESLKILNGMKIKPNYVTEKINELEMLKNASGTYTKSTGEKVIVTFSANTNLTIAKVYIQDDKMHGYVLDKMIYFSKKDMDIELQQNAILLTKEHEETHYDKE